MNAVPREERFSPSTFHRVAGLVTSGDEKLIRAVDYVTEILLDDPVSRVQDMIDDSCHDRTEEHRELTHLLRERDEREKRDL